VRVVEDGRMRVRPDTLATEEPMEIRLVTGGKRQTVAVTMRTPGADFELAAGFLYGEGIVSSRDEIEKISYCVDSDVDAEQRYNIVNVELRGNREYDLRSLERHFYTTSACGVCGKASLEQLDLRGCPVVGPGPEVSAGTIYQLPGSSGRRRGSSRRRAGCTRRRSSIRMATCWRCARTSGRHNATDKLVGWALLGGKLPLSENIVMVSGRSSFEILQSA
jgi:FdhD protein